MVRSRQTSIGPQIAVTNMATPPMMWATSQLSLSSRYQTATTRYETMAINQKAPVKIARPNDGQSRFRMRPTLNGWPMATPSIGEELSNTVQQRGRVLGPELREVTGTILVLSRGEYKSVPARVIPCHPADSVKAEVPSCLWTC